MSSAECDKFQTDIMAHFRNGQPGLTVEAKAHFGDCEACITAVTRILDQAAEGTARRTRGVRAFQPTANVLKKMPAEAQQALEHGRQVLKRELGI